LRPGWRPTGIKILSYTVFSCTVQDRCAIVGSSSESERTTKMSEAIFADAEADWDELPPVNRHERRANAVGETRGEMERKVRYEDLPPTAIIMHKDLPPGAKYSRTHQYRLVAAGLFPKKVRLSPGRTGWLKADVDHWIRTRPTVEPGERTVSEATRQKLRDRWEERRRRAAERLLEEAN
jgi:Prophage CP4-57 regulatory protein (AlpA)